MEENTQAEIGGEKEGKPISSIAIGGELLRCLARKTNFFNNFLRAKKLNFQYFND